MADLNVTFAGLALASPLIVEFRDRIPHQDLVLELAEAGAGAFLFPPLNEERLNWEPDSREVMENNRTDASDRHSERIRRDMNRSDYMEQVSVIAGASPVPIITALQCSQRNQWLNMARMMSDAGAAAVELHPIVERDWRSSRSDRIEKEIIRISNLVAGRMDTPVVVRLVAAPYGMQAVVQSLADSSVRGVVLTGSSFMTTIDADAGIADPESQEELRNDAAYLNSQATVNALYRRVTPHLAPIIPPGRTSALVESTLAGATLAVLPVGAHQEADASGLVSEHLRTLHGWMRRKKHSSLFDFRGILSDSRRSSSLENPGEE